MKTRILLGVMGLVLPLAAFAVTPLAPLGATASSSGGGKQDTRTYATGSKSGQVDLFFNMLDVEDEFRVFNGRQRLTDLDLGYTNGDGNVGTVFAGSSKNITVIFNPGGNPNPTTNWDYAIVFTYNDGTAEYEDIFSTYTDLDNRVIPGVTSVGNARQTVEDLKKSVLSFSRAFPPTVKLVVDRRDTSQALVLPTRNVDADEVDAKYNQVLGDMQEADNAFSELTNIGFEDITGKLNRIIDQVANLPGDLTNAASMVDFIASHRPGVEQSFQDISSARDERDNYNFSRDDAARALVSQTRKVALMRRAVGISNNAMRAGSRQTRLDRFRDLLALTPLERAVLDNSHSGILSRIR